MCVLGKFDVEGWVFINYVLILSWFNSMEYVRLVFLLLIMSIGILCLDMIFFLFVWF